MRTIIFFVVKVIIAIIGLCAMYLSANFWIGSQESWKEAIDTGFWEFLFSRLSVTFLVGLIFVLISLLVSRMYWWKQKRDKSKVKNSVIYEIAFAFIAAIGFVVHLH